MKNCKGFSKRKTSYLKADENFEDLKVKLVKAKALISYLRKSYVFKTSIKQTLYTQAEVARILSIDELFVKKYTASNQLQESKLSKGYYDACSILKFKSTIED